MPVRGEPLALEPAYTDVRNVDPRRFRELRRALRELFTDAAGWAITVWSARDRTAAPARVAGSGVALLTSEERMLARVCRAPLRTWCSAECGNRARVTRRTRRRRGGRGDGTAPG